MFWSILLIGVGKACGKVESSKNRFDSLRFSGLAGSFAIVVEAASSSVAVVEDGCPSEGVSVRFSDDKALSGPRAFSAVDISWLAGSIGYLVTEVRFFLRLHNHLPSQAVVLYFSRAAKRTKLAGKEERRT